MKIDKEQLAYYERELQYLRKSGAEFARQHPKVASSLGLTPTSSSDPQVERLIESFAFLTSTLQRKYDDQFPTFSQTMLGVLYPQLVAPIPPCRLRNLILTPVKEKAQQAKQYLGEVICMCRLIREFLVVSRVVMT